MFAGVGLHVSKINDVYSYEDQMIREYIMRLITRNQDAIARMHWTKQSCAIWSNECTLHAATVSCYTPAVDKTLLIVYLSLTHISSMVFERAYVPLGLEECHTSTQLQKVAMRLWGCLSTESKDESI